MDDRHADHLTRAVEGLTAAVIAKTSNAATSEELAAVSHKIVGIVLPEMQRQIIEAITGGKENQKKIDEIFTKVEEGKAKVEKSVAENQ